MPKIADPMSLLVNSQAVEHEIRADEEDPDVVVKVWVKELSFMQMQEAIKTFVAISADGSVDTGPVMSNICLPKRLKRLSLVYLYRRCCH